MRGDDPNATREVGQTVAEREFPACAGMIRRSTSDAQQLVYLASSPHARG